MQQVDAGALLEHLDAELVLAAVAAGGVGSGGLVLRAYSTNSGSVLTGSFGLTDRKNWFDATLEIATRSLSVSNGIDG